MGEKGGAPPDVLAPILGSDLPAIRKLELAILYRAYLDTHKIQGYRQEYARIAEHKIQEAIEWIRSENGKAICREFGINPETLVGGQTMGKPEPLDMQAILDQQVKLAASMERLQEAIGPVADAIRRGMTYDLVRNKRVQITANDRVEMYAGKDAEAIAIRVDHNLAAGDFTYWVGGRAYTALSYAYNHSNATPDEIVIPLDERGDKIEFSSTVTGVLTYTGLTLQQALPKMLTQLAVVRAVGIVGAGATQADPVYAELTGRNATGPTLLATLPYTDFTASANFRSAFSGKLSRSASRRTITLITTLDQPISDIKGLVVDSSAVSQAGIPAALTGVGLYVEFDFAGVLANTQYYEWNSDQYTALAGIGDSFIVDWTMGATAATSGNVYLFVTEQ